MDDNSNQNNPNQNSSSTLDAPLPADQTLPDQAQPNQSPQTDQSTIAPALDLQTPSSPPSSLQETSFNTQPGGQTQAVPDYSSTLSQMQAEAGVQPQSQQVPEGIGQNEASTQNTGMSQELSSANFNSPPREENQLLPGESPTTLPAGSIPTDSQGVPHFASQEGAVSSYSPFQTSSSQTPAQAPQPQETAPPVDIPEPAPTDLSQLTENANGQNTQSNTVYTPPVANTDTLVVSGDASSTPNTITAEHRKGLPLIAIIGALVLLLVVAAASAYFILGIGQTQVPAQETPTPSSVPAQTPAITPTPESSPSDLESINGGSSDFGSLTGEEPTTSGVFQATSAADLIRQRQQASQSPSPTPVQ